MRGGAVGVLGKRLGGAGVTGRDASTSRLPSLCKHLSPGKLDEDER